MISYCIPYTISAFFLICKLIHKITLLEENKNNIKDFFNNGKIVSEIDQMIEELATPSFSTAKVVK